jgi:15-cis-phytoene synthase
MSVASQITRKAKSNLAFALKILPRDRREDMVVFYAFCRTMDDLADDPGMPAEERARSLDFWKNGIAHGFAAPDEFQREVISLRDRQRIPNELLIAVIDGCWMDLQPQRFATWEDLSDYIWKVACAVGLVSIRIFGCTDPGSERYALALGHALQLTNILRDIEEDLANGRRIYLPLGDLARFGYTEQDLAARVRDDRFLALMEFEADRAESYFREAAEALPTADRSALLPARIMGEIYQLLLERMRADRFHVFEKRYRISKARKLAILSKHLIARSC